MIYLIDGHNLIGKMPDIHLSDPDDEEKLVHRLQNWVAGDPKRRIHIIFDNGEFGGLSPQLSGLRVRVEYARLGRTADDELIRALKHLNNPQEYTLITSDREILAVARKRRVGYILSEEFVVLMAADATERLALKDVPPEAEHDPGTRPEVDVSTAEVEEWLQVFDKPIPSTRPRRQPSAENKTSPTHGRVRSPQEMKADGHISEEDLATWLDVFGEVPPKPTPSKPETDAPTPLPADTPQPKAPPRRSPPKRPRRPANQQKYTDDKLSADEVDEWLDIFGDLDNS